MIDIKRELLVFLYEHRHSMQVVPINDVFKNSGHRDIDIKNLLKDLKKNEIILLNNDYWALATSPPPHGEERFWKTIENTPISAKLTHVIGQQYVLNNYLKTEKPTITAGQLVYSHGDINSPITLSDNHSVNHVVNPTEIKKKSETFKNILTIIGLLLSAIGVYFAYLKLK